MEDNVTLIEKLLEDTAAYSKTSIELIKLKTVDKVTDHLSSLVPKSILTIVICTFLMFLNLGLAMWFGELLGHFYYGFLIVACFYLLIATLIYLFARKWLKRIAYDSLIRSIQIEI